MAQGINPDRMFDKRVVQRNIRTGRVNKADYEAFVSSLPDLAPQIRAHDDGGDDDGFDLREARAQARVQAPAARPAFEAPRPSITATPVVTETPTPTPVAPSFTQAPPAPAPMQAAPAPAPMQATPAPTPEAPAPAAPSVQPPVESDVRPPSSDEPSGD